MIFQPFGSRNRGFFFFFFVPGLVLRWPILIGPGKAGNYGKAWQARIRFKPPLSETGIFSEAAQFVLLFTQDLVCRTVFSNLCISGFTVLATNFSCDKLSRAFAQRPSALQPILTRYPLAFAGDAKGIKVPEL